LERTLTTHEVAKMAQVHRDTLLRWLREGRIPEPSRDRNGWRVFTPEEAEGVVNYAKQEQQPAPRQRVRESPSIYILSPISKLQHLNWDFEDANTGYLTHSLHPYPAKFIPQIPNALIQELSSVSDTVLDPFCGSGTTLIEALLLKRHCIGIDANPLACLITRAKTARLGESEIENLCQLENKVVDISQQQSYKNLPLFPDLKFESLTFNRPSFDGVDFWFEPHVIDELALLKTLCLSINNNVAKQVALMIFSSIIVSVSRQDSDTRYVRRDKNIPSGETLQRFARALGLAIKRVSDLTELTDPHFTCEVINANVLDEPDIELVDLVVCSPPYPNAYSYHLYHRTRMLWLDMDQPTFKSIEIGSHRKYSKKSENAANAETFRSELHQIMMWLNRSLRVGGYICFVIGDSVLKGEVIHNDELFIEVAEALGYQLEANFNRRLKDGKKSFNPAIGKIKDEHIVILRKIGG